MNKRIGARRGRRKRRAALRLALLMLPALFWAVVFAALAGGGQVAHIAVRAPEAAQWVVAATCLLLAALLSLSVVRSDGRTASQGASPSRIRVAGVVSLFVLAALAALGTV